MRGARLAAAVALTVLVSGLAPPEERGRETSAVVLDAADVPRQPTARAQLAYAQRAKQALAGTRGRERMARRWEAARAFAAVRLHHPRERCLGAEAAFRAGELLRGGGDLEVALHEFRAVRVRCAEGAFGGRALLEIAHVERRLGHGRAALDAYQELYADPRMAPGLRDEALLWAGRVHADAGRYDEAWRRWERVARVGEDPVRRVEAYDLMALSLIERGDLEGAAGVLERCRGALREVAAERTETGERVRGAMVSMRAVERLRRSVARRREGVRVAGEGGE